MCIKIIKLLQELINYQFIFSKKLKNKMITQNSQYD